MTELNYIKIVTSVLSVEKANKIANSVQTDIVISTVQQPRSICKILQDSDIILYNDVDTEKLASIIEKRKLAN